MNTSFSFEPGRIATMKLQWRHSIQQVILCSSFSKAGKTLVFIFVLLSYRQSSSAQKATWIWYPGDFEINLANKMQNRRTDRNTFFPPFWKMDTHYVLMDFHKTFDLTAPEEITVYTEGTFNLKLDGVQV